MRFKCVHESWRDLIDSRFVASHLSNSNNSRSSAHIAVRHIVGGEEDDKEDVLGVISLVIQGRGRGRVRPMGRGNGRVAGKGDENRTCIIYFVNLRLSLLLFLGFRCEEEEEEVVGPCPDQGEWSSLSDLLHCHRLHKL
ncbi:hypothetical protein ACFX14_045936 [Malus domestica]